MIGLTDRQNEVLAFIRSYIATNQFPPTLAEIGDHFKFSRKTKQGALRHLDALERKGYIQRTPRTARGIRILKEPYAEE